MQMDEDGSRIRLCHVYSVSIGVTDDVYNVYKVHNEEADSRLVMLEDLRSLSHLGGRLLMNKIFLFLGPVTMHPSSVYLTTDVERRRFWL